MPLDVSAHRTGLRRGAQVVTAIAALLLCAAVAPAYAAPAASTSSTPSSTPAGAGGQAASAAPTSTIDPAAPTPTTPPAGGPAQGFGPGGITIGGPQLDTRGRVTYDGAPELPADLNVHGLVVADLGSGQILAAQDPHGKYYPASTLKTLTFVSLYHQLDPNQVLTATREDATVEGSRVGIVENGKYTVAQLWTALILQSGNDAAQMLTEAAGGKETALKLMNAKAKELQAYDTLAGSTSGLDVAGQSSSPYDLCLFMRQIVEDSSLRAIAGQLLGQLPAQPPQYPQPLSFGTQNQLMHSYPGTIAGKTGFTDAARHTFVAAAERNGRTLVVSLMDAENKPVPNWKQAMSLLDWGFASPVDAHGAGKLVTPDEVSEIPPASSSAAQAAASGSGVAADTAVSQQASADLGKRGRSLTTWPLWPILGVLLAVALWIAAPRRSKVARDTRPKHRP
ncbi:D-alanyl-D-alanine carboxypeptidase family protein [Cumulibacter manganitolerans]|uniref:D-alanyl-D-alanine carboxypeptidase family protein n=1 Tax=Cumulibacter manganitolerans TaxID=1884992 RepID=UPI0012965689|nr:serine hydrolase [Cumulibacter manganitolerans]